MATQGRACAARRGQERINHDPVGPDIVLEEGDKLKKSGIAGVAAVVTVP